MKVKEIFNRIRKGVKAGMAAVTESGTIKLTMLSWIEKSLRK